MLSEAIERSFSYHPPRPGQPERYGEIRAVAKQLAYLVEDHCPAGRERSLAMTHLEAAVMWANAAIAREDPERSREVHANRGRPPARLLKPFAPAEAVIAALDPASDGDGDGAGDPR